MLEMFELLPPKDYWWSAFYGLLGFLGAFLALSFLSAHGPANNALGAHILLWAGGTGVLMFVYTIQHRLGRIIEMDAIYLNIAPLVGITVLAILCGFLGSASPESTMPLMTAGLGAFIGGGVTVIYLPVMMARHHREWSRWNRPHRENNPGEVTTLLKQLRTGN